MKFFKITAEGIKEFEGVDNDVLEFYDSNVFLTKVDALVEYRQRLKRQLAEITRLLEETNGED